MTEAGSTAAFLRLIAWLSPAFPVGAFSYSGGLEQAVHDNRVRDRASLSSWTAASMMHGALWNDAVIMAEAYRAIADEARLRAAMELAEALPGSAERHRETMLQGEAFLAAAANWPHPVFGLLGEHAAYPVAVGAVAGAHETGLETAIAAYLHAQLSNLVSVAIRCGVIGQKEGVATLAQTEGLISETAARAARSSLDDLGSAAILADVTNLRHETLSSRLFRS